jgi:hypothetical protein
MCTRALPVPQSLLNFRPIEIRFEKCFGSATALSLLDERAVDWWRAEAGRGGAHEWRTADPSASPDFLSRVAASVSCVWFSLERTTSVVAGESSEAGNPSTLGMTKRRGSLQGEGSCWMKEWLLNRDIFHIQFGKV